MDEALLVIDMAKDFVDGRLAVGQPAKDIVPFIVEECQRTLTAGGVVIFPTDFHHGGIDGKWPPHCDPTTDGGELYGEIGTWYNKHRTFTNVEYFPKTKYNAFFKTKVAEYLRYEKVTTVKLVGVCTDICIFNSAAGAYFDGFDIKVLKRGCATLDFLKENEEPAYRMMKQQFFAEIVE